MDFENLATEKGTKIVVHLEDASDMIYVNHYSQVKFQDLLRDFIKNESVITGEDVDLGPGTTIHAFLNHDSSCVVYTSKEYELWEKDLEKVWPHRNPRTVVRTFDNIAHLLEKSGDLLKSSRISVIALGSKYPIGMADIDPDVASQILGSILGSNPNPVPNPTIEQYEKSISTKIGQLVVESAALEHNCSICSVYICPKRRELFNEAAFDEAVLNYKADTG